MKIALTSAFAAGFAVSTFAAPGDILFQDDFDNVTSSANYTIAGADFGDGATFGFDYTDYTDGQFSGSGLLLETDDEITAFVNGLSVNVPVSITFQAIGKAVSGGSTEYLTAGVYDDSALPFSDPPGPASDGVFIAASTDSDFGAAGDFAVFESFDGAAPTALSFMDAAGDADSGTAFAAILPEGTSAGGVSLQAGVINTTATAPSRLLDFEIIVDGDQLTWLIDGIELTTVTTSKVATGGIGIGINDPFPGFNNGTVGLGDGTSFVVDNLVVTEVPEPATVGLLAAAGLLGLARRRSQR
jgi:hypothetical protein